MSSTRWDPWGDIISLREAMTNLMEESFVRPRSGGGDGGTAGLAVDVRETAAHYRVTASVPGVAPEDVEITVLGDTLRISGERQEPSDDPSAGDTGRWLVRERRFGPFARTITLPAALRPDAAHADFKDGVLTVTLPKADEVKPRTIPVRPRADGANQEIPVSTSESD